jgi:hypothetical protein
VDITWRAGKVTAFRVAGAARPVVVRVDGVDRRVIAAVER